MNTCDGRFCWPKVIAFIAAFACTVAVSVRSHAQEPPDGPWSGQLQCVLSARQAGYQSDQTHTWRITGGPPQIAGAFRQWPAEWTVTGSGSRIVPSAVPTGGVLGGLVETWTTSVPPTFAPLGIWEPPGSGRIRIGSQHGLLVARYAISGSSGSGGPTQPFLSDLQEYPLPYMEDARTSTQISGTRTRTVPGGGWRQPVTLLTTETCSWNFVKGAAGQVDPQSSGGRRDSIFAGARTALPPVAGTVAAPAQLPPVTIVPTMPGNNSVAGPAPTTTPPASAPSTTPGKEVFAGGNFTPPQMFTPADVPAAPAQTVTGGRATAPRESRGQIPALPAFAPADVPQASAPASGQYRVVMTGLWCANPTSDDSLDRDGRGDEIYALTAVRKYDRNTAQVLENTNRGTRVYGDGQQTGSVQAGTQTVRGGIRAGDLIPIGASADRKAPASVNLLPMLVWEGTLTDDADAVLISASVWESDGNRIYSNDWSQQQQAANDTLFITEKVQTQVATQGFSALVLGAADAIAPRYRSLVKNVMVGALQATLMGFPVQLFVNEAYDRPIGLVGVKGVEGANVLPNQAVVVTREIIEAALARPSAPSPPFVIAPVYKPGILFLTFTDTTGNSPVKFTDGRLAVYVMALQVERL